MIDMKAGELLNLLNWASFLITSRNAGSEATTFLTSAIAAEVSPPAQ
jgi:hypothetical protein